MYDRHPGSPSADYFPPARRARIDSWCGGVVIELGPFGLDRSVGHGGMGQVWSGLHRRLKYPVAIKFLTEKGFRNQRYLDAFRSEVRAAAALDHPHLVRVFDHGEVDTRTESATGGAI